MSTVVGYDGTVHNADFLAFRNQMAETFAEIVKTRPVFRSTAENELFDLYLSELPEEARQYHTCSCCRNFLNKYGSLVYVDDKGHIRSALFQGTQPSGFYAGAWNSMKLFVEVGAIKTVFVSERTTLGEAVSDYHGYMEFVPRRPADPNGDPWHHMYADWPEHKVYNRADRTHRQHMAMRIEDCRNVMRACREIDNANVVKALQIVRTMPDAKGGKFVGPLQWFDTLQKTFKAATPATRENFVWAAIGDAPDGFVHIASTVVGELINDVAEGKSLDIIKKKFTAMVDSLTYQRAQKPAKEGNIKRAESLIDKMDIVASLERRHALITGLPERAFYWRPKAKAQAAKSAGVFGHLRNATKQAEATVIEGRDPEVMTFISFVRKIMPHATRIQYRVPSYPLSYASITTATNADAKPILMWDKPDARNPHTWYTYKGGSRAASWGLEAGGLIDVLGIVSKPSQWTEGFEFRGEGVMFILEGCSDQKNDGGLALFPDNLDRQLHEVRQTIEEFSNEGELTFLEGQQASGLLMSNSGNTYRYEFIVEMDGVRSVYRIDRYE